uniref:HTH CENPB-type domain-containing protein n=1 Tax=Strigamia maritima TaxID=126957 RepID=T1IMM1_STRMM
MPRSFDLKFKLEVLNFAEENSGEAAARKFGVTPSTIRGWKRNKEEIIFTALYASDGAKKKRVQGAGRKLISAELESDLMEWILEKQRNHERVSRKMIRKIASDIFASYEDSRKETFKASPGWLSKFLKRNNLSLRHKLATKPQQNNLMEINEKIARFIHNTNQLRIKNTIKEHEIIALDETGVWFDMPGSWTFDKEDLKSDKLKYTASEQIYFTVVLSAKGDGTKLKPFVIFNQVLLGDQQYRVSGTKKLHATDSPNQKSSNVPGVGVGSSVNGWMNNELMIDLLDHVFHGLSSSKRVVVWDAYRYHISDSTKTYFDKYNALMAVIPAGLTKYVQASDACWKKPFKSLLDDCYNEWISGNEDKVYTEDGNVKLPSCSVVATWVKRAWDSLSTDFIANSFKVCGLTTSIDGSEDHLVDCLMSSHTCGAWAVLQNYRQNNCDVELSLVEDSDENERNEQNEVLIDSSDEESEGD